MDPWSVITAPPAAWPVTAAPRGPIFLPGVPNFGVVAPGCVYRSGQPSRDGIRRLAETPLRTMVNLRAEAAGEDAREEEALAVRPGLQYVRIPVTDRRPPAAAQAEAFLALAGDPGNWPLLVHCHGGEGRVATMAALLRCCFDGWTVEQALREAVLYRKYRLLVRLGLRGRLDDGQEAFLRDFLAEHARR